MQECIWCSRVFARRDTDTNHYRLLSAGKLICWDCSDLYDEAEIKMHMVALKAKIDSLLSRLTTESGHELPLTIQTWSRGLLGRPIGRAVDRYGKLWSVRPGSGYATLKPIGDKTMGRMI